jgi:hypothetical protein
VCLAPSIITVDRQLRDVPPRAYEVNSIYFIALCTYGCVLFPAEQHIKLDLNRLGYPSIRVIPILAVSRPINAWG